MSYFISEGDKLLESESGGYLLRSKKYKDDEGGVNAGYSVIDGLMIE